MSTDPNSPARSEPVRKVGRPRAFEDTDVFAAIRTVLIRDGFYELTLHAVANELDVSTPALARRFGDKHEMLEAYLDYTEILIAPYLNAIKDRFESPLDSLRARWRIPVNHTPDEYANRDAVTAWVEFLLAVRTDPAYGPILERRTIAWIADVTERLEAAHRAGEIVEVDFAMFARVLSGAMTGAMLLWFEHRRGDLYAEIERIFEFVIAPYKVTQESPARSNRHCLAAGE